MAYLILSRRGEVVTRFLLEQERVTVGRDPECDLTIDDPGISRQHCDLQWDGNHFLLTDHSRNGTFLDGERMRDTALLHDDSRIELGAFMLEFHSGPAEPLQPTVGQEYQPTLILKYEPQSKALTIERVELAVELPQGGEAHHLVEHLPITLGAAPYNSVAIPHDPYISRHHCRIEASAEGLVLRDCGSRNGTWWKGHQVQSQLLPERGAFQIGKTKLTYRVRIDKELLEPAARHRCGELFGCSRAMQEVFALVDRVAPSDATILIVGESGTGKELLARALHASSGRAPRPFVAINCGAIPATIIESELFGHERGAFTGATTQHRGVFEQAQGGTLFLDEIGEMPLELQVRLLRVLETRTVRRVGGTSDLAVDFRLIAATHRRLPDLIAEGAFREDLYYRLFVVPIELAPLRQRPEDITMLADHFSQILRRPGQHVEFSPEARAALLTHSWPGNVRELKNTIERALISTHGETIELEALQFAPTSFDQITDPRIAAGNAQSRGRSKRLKEAERVSIEAAIRTHSGNLTQAAKSLGIARSTLWAKIKEFAVDVDRYRRAMP
ncbi:MAG: sigma 54-interacting transcriptional regulator [Deltaproteobacteria bacterium]|nr:sigma 54-interacting transcriptional regulator [Deltaproteobacteria bacterium]